MQSLGLHSRVFCAMLGLRSKILCTILGLRSRVFCTILGLRSRVFYAIAQHNILRNPRIAQPNIFAILGFQLIAQQSSCTILGLRKIFSCAKKNSTPLADLQPP